MVYCLRVPNIWVSDTAWHFKNCLKEALEKALDIQRRFEVVSFQFSSGACEGTMREVVRTLKAMRQEGRNS